MLTPYWRKERKGENDAMGVSGTGAVTGQTASPDRVILAKETDVILVWPSIRTAIRPAASVVGCWTTVPSEPLSWAAATRPPIWTRVPTGNDRAVSAVRGFFPAGTLGRRHE